MRKFFRVRKSHHHRRKREVTFRILLRTRKRNLEDVYVGSMSALTNRVKLGFLILKDFFINNENFYEEIWKLDFINCYQISFKLSLKKDS